VTAHARVVLNHTHETLTSSIRERWDVMVASMSLQKDVMVFAFSQRDLLHYHQPARTLRSSSQLLYQPVTRINFQSKAFSITAPAVWNSLSPVTKSSATITTFKTKPQNSSLLHTTRSNISSASGASDSNSRHTAPPIKCFFDI